MGRGGIESFMMNYYRHFDRTKIQIDFVVHGFEKSYYDEEIKELGGNLYHVPIKSIDYKGNVIALKEIICSKKYNIIHSHMDAMSFIPLKIAKQAKVPYRIAHSHNTNHLTNNSLKILFNEYARFSLRKQATHFFACSNQAGKWLFGNTLFEKKGMVINNAIETKNFLFDLDIRNKIRIDLDIKDKFVIGHVGRFDYQKNHVFLIEIFQEVLKIKENALLVLVGEGHLQKDIKKKVNDLGLNDKIIFLGSRSDVNQLLNAFDVFLLPSQFEGLGIALIESQTNGLPTFVSNAVPKDVAITNLISFKPLDNAREWVYDILEAKRDFYTDMDIEITRKGYDIVSEAKKLEDFYSKLMI